MTDGDKSTIAATSTPRGRVTLEERLAAGVETMASLRRETERAQKTADAANAAAIEASKPRTHDWKLIVTLSLAAAGGFATLLTRLNDAVTKPELERARDVTDTRLRGVEQDIGSIKLEQVKARGTVEAIQAEQNRQDDKLDALLKRGRR